MVTSGFVFSREVGTMTQGGGIDQCSCPFVLVNTHPEMVERPHPTQGLCHAQEAHIQHAVGTDGTEAVIA